VPERLSVLVLVVLSLTPVVPAVIVVVVEDSSARAVLRATAPAAPAANNFTNLICFMNSSDSITAYTPGSDYITFRTESSTTPVKYYYTKKTVLVDPEGRTVEWTALKPDMPVTYTYTKEGDRIVVTKVTLAKPLSYYEKKETTTTTRP
jgi:hypothetical protein